MNGGFFSEVESERIYKNWGGTLHDINHAGTAYPAGDITAFIGYHTNVKHNSKTKEVTMDIKVNNETMYARAWKAYVETCELAGKIPNVSVTYLGRQKLVAAKELPNGADYKSEGFSDDDFVPVLTNVEPVCISTVLQGRCNDKDGCGIKNDEQEIANAFEVERQKLMKRIKSKEKLIE